MSTGMAGVGFFDTGHRTPRTRDWSRPPESEKAKPKTATEIAADAFLAQKERWRHEAEDDERKKAEEQRRRHEDERKKREAEHQRVEAEKDKRVLDERRAQFFSEMDRDAVMTDLAFAPHGGATVEERSAVSEKMDALGLGLGSAKFSPEAWVMELLRLRLRMEELNNEQQET